MEKDWAYSYNLFLSSGPRWDPDSAESMVRSGATLTAEVLVLVPGSHLENDTCLRAQQHADIQSTAAAEHHRLLTGTK